MAESTVEEHHESSCQETTLQATGGMQLATPGAYGVAAIKPQ